MAGIELIQIILIVFTTLSQISVVITMIYALLCWRQRNMMYFAFLVLAVFMNVLGYSLEISSTTLEAALLGCKVAYIGIPLTGFCLLLFSIDYSAQKRLPLPTRLLLLTPALIFTVSVFIYPWSNLFYLDVSFSTEGLVNHLVVTPGPLYYPCVFYVAVLTLIASVNLTVGFYRHKQFEGTVIFLIAIALPLAVQFYVMVFGLIDGWNPLRMTLALSSVLLTVYLARYKQAEWLSTGRELVVQDMKDAFILLDNRNHIIDHNSAAEELFPQLKKGGRRRRGLDALSELPLGEFLSYGLHQADMQQQDKTMNLKIATSPLKTDEKITGTLIVIGDDTINNQMMQELTRMARIDELTGLNNRATFFHDASLSFGLAHRKEENRGCALMMDIDLFKCVNDTYGHAVGDEVLAFIGSLLLKRLRCTDISGRYGGEELCVWMPATPLEGALLVAEEIREAIARHEFTYENTTFCVTISIGVAGMDAGGTEDFEDIIKKADDALYEAKGKGRNCVRVYQSDASL